MTGFKQNFCSLSFAMVFALSLSVGSTASQAQQKSARKPYDVPMFRHIDKSKKNLDLKAYPAIRFAITDDFPPFSYRVKSGALNGFNVAIANSVCRTLRISCVFIVRPFDEANRLVENNEADAVITGLRQNASSEQTLSFTRPYYRFSARFAARISTSAKSSAVREMTGKRLGVVTGTHHADFLNENFRRSKIRQFNDFEDSVEALRTGAIDAIFGDSLKLMFWLKGNKSKNCCRFVGDAYLDPQTFSQPMAIGVKRDNKKLRALLDHALDRIQISGRYTRIFRNFFPLDPLKPQAKKSTGPSS